MMDDTFLKNGFYLALLYLVISGNYLGNLFGCRVQQVFRENMAMKHLLGFFTAYFLIILAAPPAGLTPVQVLMFAAAIYAWFYLTTKMHVSLWIPMIITIMGTYVLYVYMKQTGAADTKDSPTAEQTERLERIRKVGVILAAVLTIVGVILYYGEKRVEYGSDFDVWIFWAGTPDCKAQTPPVSISESLGAVVFGTRTSPRRA
jgi:hypothetical protein